MRVYSAALILIGLSWFGCQREESGYINSVTGTISPEQLGFTLIHEHLLVDFGGAADYSPEAWQHEEVIARVLPFLQEINKLGIETLVDCTPEYLGRDPVLLKKLSLASGVQLITNTGLYGAVDSRFLPDYARTESAQQLAQRWIDEWKNGIGQTGIKPGFIKIGVNPEPLSALHKKLIEAAALAHLQTGLTIMSHTGPAPAAYKQLDILDSLGVPASAFVWVHAQAEPDLDHHVTIAKRGAWVSLDGISSDNLDQYVRMLSHLRDEGLLSHTVISHDAGWYSPGEPNGGDFRAFDTISTRFLPMLKENGFSEADIRQLLITNPRKVIALPHHP